MGQIYTRNIKLIACVCRGLSKSVRNVKVTLSGYTTPPEAWAPEKVCGGTAFPIFLRHRTLTFNFFLLAEKST